MLAVQTFFMLIYNLLIVGWDLLSTFHGETGLQVEKKMRVF